MADRSCVVLIRNDCLLMVRQRYRGRTIRTLPGGGMEPGETPEEAAVREVREETGLEVELASLLVRRPRESGTGVYYCYLGRILGGEVALGADPEFAPDCQELEAVEWVPMSRLWDHPEVAPLLDAIASTLLT